MSTIQHTKPSRKDRVVTQIGCWVGNRTWKE